MLLNTLGAACHQNRNGKATNYCKRGIQTSIFDSDSIGLHGREGQPRHRIRIKSDYSSGKSPCPFLSRVRLCTFNGIHTND